MLGGTCTYTYLPPSCRRYDFIYSAHDWSSFRETSQSHTLNPFGHNLSTNRLLHLLILSSMYSTVCAGVQTGVSYRVLAMIPHSAARLCNTVVTVLGSNVVLAMYQQGIGHVRYASVSFC